MALIPKCIRMPKKDEVYFDNCPICRAQKAADDAGRLLTLSELRAASAEAKKMGAYTGGNWDLE